MEIVPSHRGVGNRGGNISSMMRGESNTSRSRNFGPLADIDFAKSPRPDRLDLAMGRIFGILERAHIADTASGGRVGGKSASVVLVQRALSVLYQLSVGVTIVHAGSSYTPRLMCSGRLLLESEPPARP